MNTAPRWAYLLLLGALAGIGPFTIDLYLPAFPEIVADLAASPGSVQGTLGATAIGFASGQLVVGPLSDRVGRRGPLIAAIALHIVASLAIMIAPTIEAVTVLRLIQGLGSSGSAVIVLAIARDLLVGRRLFRALAMLSLVQSLAPVIAPIVGSQLLRVMPWRGLFLVLAAYGVALLTATVLVVRETNPRTLAHVDDRSVFARYGSLLRDRVFVGIALVGGTQFVVLLNYLAAAPFLLRENLGLSPSGFALAFAATAIVIAGATQVANLLARVLDPPFIVVISQALTATGGVGILLVTAQAPSLTGVLVCFLITGLAYGLALPCLPAIAFSRVTTSAGSAAALLGACSSGIAGLVTLITGAVSDPAHAVGFVQFAAATVGAIVLWSAVRPHRLRWDNAS